MTTSPAITISNLRIRYGENLLFDGLNLYLPAASVTCLLGPSGIGKTTILRFIAGLKYEKNTEYSGDIFASDTKLINGRVSYMAQNDLLMPWLSILDNALLGPHLRREKITPDLRQKALDLLNTADLKNVSLKPHQLSHGMKQRAALVRTLIENQPIVLMDEPFSALDIATKIKLQDLAAKLLINRTVLLVTHDPWEALRLGNHIYVMTGTPAKISGVITQETNAPYDPQNDDLLKKQGKILQLLTA